MLWPIDRLSATDDGAVSETYRRIHYSTQEGFQLAFLLKDCNGWADSIRDFRNQPVERFRNPKKGRRLMLLVFGNDGNPIRDATVVFTIICPHNVQKMVRSTRGQIGYHFEFEAAQAAQDGIYRVEAEIATKGQYLTDSFSLEILKS